MSWISLQIQSNHLTPLQGFYFVSDGTAGASDDRRSDTENEEFCRHEVEILPGRRPESEESACAWRHCTKNPDHTTFITASTFEIKPTSQTRRLSNFIRAFSELTVKLRVTCTTRERSDADPFSYLKGLAHARLGSGWVERISGGEGPCLCRACTESCSSPSQGWWEITVNTARLVVYNTEESQSTVVEFFDDDLKSKLEERVKTVSGSGGTVRDRDYQRDYDICLFSCASHDKDLAERLIEAKEDIVKDLSRSPFATYTEEDLMTIVIISHPHGAHKHITWGDVATFRLGGDRCYEYTTDTSPGSCGAPVPSVFPTFTEYSWLPDSSWRLFDKKDAQLQC